MAMLKQNFYCANFFQIIQNKENERFNTNIYNLIGLCL